MYLWKYRKSAIQEEGFRKIQKSEKKLVESQTFIRTPDAWIVNRKICLASSQPCIIKFGSLCSFVRIQINDSYCRDDAITKIRFKNILGIEILEVMIFLFQILTPFDRLFTWVTLHFFDVSPFPGGSAIVNHYFDSSSAYSNTLAYCTKIPYNALADNF